LIQRLQTHRLVVTEDRWGADLFVVEDAVASREGSHQQFSHQRQRRAAPLFQASPAKQTEVSHHQGVPRRPQRRL